MHQVPLFTIHDALLELHIIANPPSGFTPPLTTETRPEYMNGHLEMLVAFWLYQQSASKQ